MAEKRAQKKADMDRVLPTAKRTPSPEEEYTSIRIYRSRAGAENDRDVLRRKGFPDVKILTEQLRLMDTPSRPRSMLEYVRLINLDHSTPIQGDSIRFLADPADIPWDLDDDILPPPHETSSPPQMLPGITENDDEWTDDGENPFLIDGYNLFRNVPKDGDDQNPFLVADDHPDSDEDRNALPGWITLDGDRAGHVDEEVDELLDDDGDKVDGVHKDSADELEDNEVLQTILHDDRDCLRY